jgi:hypothetical protein
MYALVVPYSPDATSESTKARIDSGSETFIVATTKPQTLWQKLSTTPLRMGECGGGYGRTVSRRMVMVGAVAMVLLVLAASSGPVRVWITPPSGPSPSLNDSPSPRDMVAPQDSVSTDRSGGPNWVSTFLLLLGVLLIVLAATVVVRSVGTLGRPGRRRLRARLGRRIIPLPELPESELTVDVVAARAALAGGSPRNAIVACWMQLERDAAAAGLSRSAAETSAEYIERVVAESSVDPAPIGELAALYREARFSRHELGDDHRTRAFATLSSVAAGLRRSVEVPT